MKLTTLLILTIALISGGCVSMGPNFDPAAVATLQPGMSITQVEAAMGKPTTVVTSADGSAERSWIHSQGSLAGGKARIVVLQFDTDGKFVRMVSSTESNVR